MNRNALLLWLQNVRDLETARYIIRNKYNQQKSDYENQIKTVQAKPLLKQYPQREREGDSLLFGFCLFLFGSFLLGIIYAISQKATDDMVMSFIMIIGLTVTGMWASKFKPESEKSYNEWREKEKEKVDKYNEAQQVIAQKGMAKRERLFAEWKQKAARYNSEYQKLTSLLTAFYNQNVLASQYRNVASVIYIYEYMSTSQASLDDTLIHEHMENGIQRLEAKLDQVIYSLDDLIYESRCMQNENRAMIQKQIKQNESMLSELKSISSSAQDAAFYSQLASNYSEANAYFSLANYLKK